MTADHPISRGCVLLSRGALDHLGRSELQAVLSHEQSHRRLGHHRHLLVARAADRAFWFVPGMRQATHLLRRSIESTADADAQQATSREAVLGALRVAAGARGEASSGRLQRGAVGGSDHSKLWVAVVLGGLAVISSTEIAVVIAWLGL